MQFNNKANAIRNLRKEFEGLKMNDSDIVKKVLVSLPEKFE